MTLDARFEERVRYALALTGIAFVLHYTWEHLQCPLFVHRPGDAPMWIAMVRATLGDVVLTWIAQLLVATCSRRWVWPRRARSASWLLLIIVGAAIAVGLETYALATGRWSYAETNPLIPKLNVSLLPVVQLVLLLLITFLLAEKVARSAFLRRRRTT